MRRIRYSKNDPGAVGPTGVCEPGLLDKARFRLDGRPISGVPREFSGIHRWTTGSLGLVRLYDPKQLATVEMTSQWGVGMEISLIVPLLRPQP